MANGRAAGRKPEEGFFVRCDASTMTQNDLDNGRLICLIGVAAVKPAEFVIFRISQMTARPLTADGNLKGARWPQREPRTAASTSSWTSPPATTRVHAGFQEVSGMNIEVTSAEYRNGNSKTTTRSRSTASTRSAT